MVNGHHNVLMIAATPFFSDRGCHIRIYSEIKYLEKLGYKIRLATYHLGDDLAGVEAKRIKTVRWYKKYTPGAAWGKIYLDFLLLKLSIEQVKEDEPDIIHAHLYEGLVVAYFTKIFTHSKAPILFDCQGSLTDEVYRYNFKGYRPIARIAYPFFWIAEKLILMMPKVIVCSSERSRTVLRNRFSVDDKKLKIVEDGFDEKIFAENKEESTLILKSELGIPKQNKVIIYTGSLVSAKGVDQYIQAIPDLLAKEGALTFLFVGYGDIEEELKRTYRSFVDNKQIVFAGRISYFELPRYLALADVAVDPKKEGSESSGKIINYLAAGLPVACFSVPLNDLREYVYEMKSFDELLLLIGKNESLTSRFDPFESKLSWRYLSDKLTLIYRDLL